MKKKTEADSELSNGSWYDELPDAVKKSVDQGLEDIRNGRVTPHEEVRKKYQKWLKK